MIIAQISDPHITVSQNAAATDAAGYLQRAVAHLLALPARPDIVIVSGDCVDTGEPAEYARFEELIRPLPMPVHVVPGNHDNRDHMLKTFGIQGTHSLASFVQYVVDSGPVRVVMLDTHVPGHGHGSLCEQRLAWLGARLAEAPTRPTVVCMHHPPFHTGLVALDQIALENIGAFEAIIAQHPQVERIVTGHVHMAITQRFAHTTVMTCPSVAHTFLPNVDQSNRLTVLSEPPACLLHVWREGGALLTYTSLIGDHGPIIELHDGTQWLQ